MVLAAMVASSTMLVIACGDDQVAATPSTGDGGASDRDGRSSSNGNDDGDDSNNDDNKNDQDSGDPDDDPGNTCAGKFEAPDLNGPGPCGTQDFGEPAAAFGPVNPDAGTTYTGTELVDGIYDAVNAERASGSSGSWRETFVVKGNRFTRIRQINTGSGGGAGPITYRSGTFTYLVSGGEQLIRMTYDCAQSGDSAVDAGDDSLPSDAVVASDCTARYRYGASGIRVTLRRR